MTKTQKDTRKKDSKQASTRPLLRSRDDRMICGVAGGLAEQIGVDVILVRLGFVVAAVIGGLGLLAYPVMAVVMPEDDGTGQPVDEGYGPRLARVLLVCALIAAALVIGAGLAAVSAWATATGHGAVVGAVVIGVGLVIAATAFAGEARRIGGPLLAVALVLGLPAGAVAAADVRFDESVGQREYRPATVADIPSGGYELGTGQLIVDLRDIPWAAGRQVDLSTDLGLGQTIVSVPPNVCVDGHTSAKGGELLVRGEQSDGVDPEVDLPQPRGNAPRLNLDAKVQFGQLIVTDQDPDQISDRGFDYDHNQFAKTSQREACGL
jgi:phage shock protein PspC (stress-responsive transcriptional regulator)